MSIALAVEGLHGDDGGFLRHTVTAARGGGRRVSAVGLTLAVPDDVIGELALGHPAILTALSIFAAGRVGTVGTAAEIVVTHIEACVQCVEPRALARGVAIMVLVVRTDQRVDAVNAPVPEWPGVKADLGARHVA